MRGVHFVSTKFNLYTATAQLVRLGWTTSEPQFNSREQWATFVFSEASKPEHKKKKKKASYSAPEPEM
jgi:hypothetical protein